MTPVIRDIHELYKLCQARFLADMNVGDEVMCVKFCKPADGGWTNSWIDDMRRPTNKHCSLNSKSNHTGGISLRLPMGHAYGYPYFCLEKLRNENT